MIQSLCGTNRLPPQEGLARALEIVQMAQNAGLSIEDARCVEIGTGWRPYVPILLQLIGAEKTTSFDINPWLTFEFAHETLLALGERTPEILATSETNEALLQTRFEKALVSANSLDELLQTLGIDYKCPGDARDTDFAPNEIDLVCSSNVLEHVSKDDLLAIHKESLRILRPGGIIVHRFNPADHFSFVDKKITTVNFLRFSESEWHWLGGSGLSFHNRLRCKQHLDLIRTAGFEIVSSRERLDHRALESLRAGQIRLHSDYTGFSAEELAADYMWVVARRPE